MRERTADELHDETFDRWRRFYRQGLISRRTFMQAVGVWTGVAAAGLAGTTHAAPAPVAAPGAVAARPARQGKDSITHILLTDLPNLDPHMHNLREGIII